MDDLTITLPEPLRRHVEERASAAGFETPSDFVLDLIERDRRRSCGGESEHDRFASAVRQAVESGKSFEVDDAWWAAKDAEYARRFGDATGP